MPEVDTTITDYELVVAAPTVSDDILGSIDPMGFNAKNKSLRLQVNLSQNGLSGCKAL